MKHWQFQQGPPTPTLSDRFWGVVIGLVTNNQDEDGLGRVKVNFPHLGDEVESHWARIAAPMAGNGRGCYFLPEVDDEVLVAFEQGDPRRPYVLGALWNGVDAPPTTNEDGRNNIRVIQSRSGHVIRLNDEDGQETIEIIDKSGNNQMTIETANNTVTIKADQDITLLAPQGTIALEAQTLSFKSSGQSTLKADAGADIQASGTLKLKGAMVNIN